VIPIACRIINTHAGNWSIALGTRASVMIATIATAYATSVGSAGMLVIRCLNRRAAALPFDDRRDLILALLGCNAATFALFCEIDDIGCRVPFPREEASVGTSTSAPASLPAVIRQG
jgi:hypothetical protein